MTDLFTQLNRGNTDDIFLVEFNVLKLADGSLTPLYFSNKPFYAADKQFLPAISSISDLDRSGNDTMDPAYLPTWGDMSFLITGAYKPDAENSIAWNLLLYKDTYTMAGQALTINIGTPGDAYVDFTIIFTGQVGEISWTDTELNLTVYDKAQELETKYPDYELPESEQVEEDSWDQSVPIILGEVKNYTPVLIKTDPVTEGGVTYSNKYALACHVIDSLVNVYFDQVVAATPAQYLFKKTDMSPPKKDTIGGGTVFIHSYGPYTGTLLQAKWIIQIDSITALNSLGVSGSEVGLATFRWKLEGDTGWRGEGILTWKLAYDIATLMKSPAVGDATMVVSGDYTGDCKLSYKIKVTRGGKIGDVICPQFEWSDDNGVTWTGPVDILDTDPIALNRGLSVAFAGVGHWNEYNWWNHVATSNGAMTVVSFNHGDNVDVEITHTGDVGVVVRFRWRNVGGDWSGELEIPDGNPIELFSGYSVQFFDSSDPGYDYESGDNGGSRSVFVQAFEVDDVWTFSFKEIPIPLEDGVTIQFFTKAGQDFYLWDEFSFILMSTILVNLPDTTDLTIDAKGLLSPRTDPPVFAATIGEMIYALIRIFAKWEDADFDLTALDAFNAAIPYAAGLVIDSPDSITSIIDQLLTGIPALYSITIAGKLYVQELVEPTGAPVLSLIDEQIMDIPAFSQLPDITKRVYLTYDTNYTTNTSKDLAGVSQERLAWLKRGNRSISRKDDTVLMNYPMASDIGPLETALNVRADAGALADKLLALYQVPHETMEVQIGLQAIPLDIGDIVMVTRGKFGQSAGQLYMVQGISINFTDGQSTVTLWR